MPSNLKHRVRERMAKTGETWVTALRHVRAEEPGAERGATSAPSAASLVSQEENLGALLRRLGATRTFAIRVGRGTHLGASGNLGAAEARARREMTRERGASWYAATGASELRIERDEHDALLASGAADDAEVQLLRSFHNDKGVTFSERCSACDRWIWCGHEEREGRCACGQSFRVAFDLARVYHWSARAGHCCMDCGAARPEAAGAARSWRAVSNDQVRCDACAARDAHPSPPRSPRLLFATVHGEQAVPLRPVSSVGRDVSCTVRLLDKIVAKEHCVLERRGGDFVLRDLGSLNGTYVNGERVRGEQRLAHGDEIAVGATRARYDDGVGPLTSAPLAISPGVYVPRLS